MTDDEIRDLFSPLWAEFQGEDCYPNKRPLLAHYTKVAVLESILKNNEIWFSHPLLMNDPEEVLFGLDASARLLFTNEKIRAACGTSQRFEMLKNTFYWLNRRIGLGVRRFRLGDSLRPHSAPDSSTTIPPLIP